VTLFQLSVKHLLNGIDMASIHIMAPQRGKKCSLNNNAQLKNFFMT